MGTRPVQAQVAAKAWGGSVGYTGTGGVANTSHMVVSGRRTHTDTAACIIYIAHKQTAYITYINADPHMWIGSTYMHMVTQLYIALVELAYVGHT